ncbi:hypothetical protein MJG53_011304 [Ovis ammon polii x Ovis aries]|uniref:Uncharacterized protein n=1 Tax=Ovis ammon polii x Ovis aries TaxID=2918886 RepID=A0ACB9US30_9CETA|nr:hypothetical protein MJG53_011304 [Ovis ammon polii x Ovis aries]
MNLEEQSQRKALRRGAEPCGRAGWVREQAGEPEEPSYDGSPGPTGLGAAVRSDPPSPVTCEDDQLTSEGKTFWRVAEELSWSEALEYCRRHHTDLADLHSMSSWSSIKALYSLTSSHEA